MDTRKGTRLAATTLAALAIAYAATAAGCATSGGFTGGIKPTETAEGFYLPDISRPEIREALLNVVTVKAGSKIGTPYAGRIVGMGTEPDWGNYVAIESSIDYIDSGEREATATFTVIYGNLKSNAAATGRTGLREGDDYGTAPAAPGGGAEAELIIAVSSRDYDELLVVDSVPACKHAGLYWYRENIIVSKNTKFMSYPPNDYEETTMGMVEHGRTEPYTSSVYWTRSRFRLTLDEYPAPVKEAGFGSYPGVELTLYKTSGIYTHAQMVDVGGYNMIVCWQRGFDEYLANEWEPGTPITLFGLFSTYDVKNDAAVFFVRDFSVKSIEERLAERPESALPEID